MCNPSDIIVDESTDKEEGETFAREQTNLEPAAVSIMKLVGLSPENGPDTVLAQNIAHNIERMRKPCRARIYLHCGQHPHQPDYDVEDVQTAFQLVLHSYPFKEALLQLLDLDVLRDMYQREGGSETFDKMIADHETVVIALLDQMGIPYHVEPSSLHLRASNEALDDIRDIRDAISGKVYEDTLSFLSWQGGSLSAWGIVESVLKLTLGFVARHLGDELPAEIVGQFEKWKISKKSGGQIIRTFEQIEYFFGKGETRADKKYDEELSREQSSKSKKRGLKELQAEREERIIAQKEILARRVQNDWFRDFHRHSPFEGVPTEMYREWYSLERNKLAHSPIQDLLASSSDHDILQSLTKAEEVIRGLNKKHVAPRVITIVGEGRDAYGAKILWFTDVTAFNKARSRKMHLDWMYIISDVRWPFLEPLAMLAPVSVKGAPDEPSIEPVMYSLEEIEAVVTGRKEKHER